MRAERGRIFSGSAEVTLSRTSFMSRLRKRLNDMEPAGPEPEFMLLEALKAPVYVTEGLLKLCKYTAYRIKRSRLFYNKH